MAFLKFNKSELVNLSYSLRREIISANKTGAYCNTSILTCNTRRYHGLLAVALDRFGGDKFLLLSALDESLIVGGKQFNLGIHCYGEVYEPRGHKYIVDFEADPVPQITYKVGDIVFRKSILLVPDQDQVMIKFELLSSPSKVTVQLRPFLAFRSIHALTAQNSEARLTPAPLQGGVSFRVYPNFPELMLQVSDSSAKFVSSPYWYNGITYSDEYRRGYDCREDLPVPGWFSFDMKEGGSVVFSASLKEELPAGLKRKFTDKLRKMPPITNSRDQLVHCADLLVSDHNFRKKVVAGFSWMYTGLLRETLQALPGLTLYAKGDKEAFEEILDNLIADEQERLFCKTTQVEAPFFMATALQAYIDYGADPAKVWDKYGTTMRGIIESYLPGERKEVSMQPDGMLWAQMDGVALSWMNAYIGGRAVTERAGCQVETNALWYNAICFCIEMEKQLGSAESDFVARWSKVRDLVKANFTKMFWNDSIGCLADYVDNAGQHLEIRPNQLFALWVKYSPVEEDLFPAVIRVVDRELLTARGVRTLSPRDGLYKGVYDGSQYERDLAYHNGSTRPFLLEQYVAVSFQVKGASFKNTARALVDGFYEDLGKHGVGSFSELYDGDPPQEPHGAISSALSTAALLSIENMLDKFEENAK